METTRRAASRALGLLCIAALPACTEAFDAPPLDDEATDAASQDVDARTTDDAGPGDDATKHDDAQGSPLDAVAREDAPPVPADGEEGVPVGDAGAGEDDVPGASGDGSTLARDAGIVPGRPFWRVERRQTSGRNRSWLVDPSGQRVFILGVNTVLRDVSCDGMLGYLRRNTPGFVAHTEWARLSTGRSGGIAVASPLRFNSVGAFSDTNDLDGTGNPSYLVRDPAAGGVGAPYFSVVTPTPRGDDRALRNAAGTVLRGGYSEARVGDPFNPAFHADLDAIAAERIAPRQGDRNLVAWYAGNEIGMFDRADRDRDGVRDFRVWIWSNCPAGSTLDTPRCAPHALGQFLRARYTTVAALDAAWERSYASFEAVATATPRPVPYVQGCNLACRQDLQRFVHDRLLREWVRQVTLRYRAADPNHLVAAPRLALAASPAYRFWAPADAAEPDRWADSGVAVPNDNAGVRYAPFDLLGRDGPAGFDFVAGNVYTGAAEHPRPWFTDGVHRITRDSGLPFMVSEFSVRARIEGWSNRGGAGAFVSSADSVPDQAQRGQRYASQVRQFIGFRDILGASWHAWSDRYLARDSSEQINMGLVHCDDAARSYRAGARWTNALEPIAETNAAIMRLIEAATGI